MKKLLILLFICCYSAIFSQGNDNKKAYVLFDALIDQKNLEINTGVKYIEIHRTQRNEHQFFKEKKPKEGAISYNNQLYYNVPLMYDTYNNDLIVYVNSIYNRYLLILDKEKVSYFTIDNIRFEKTKEFGYTQILQSKGNNKLYKLNRRILKKRYTLKNSFSKFLKDNSYKLLASKITYNPLKRNEWIKAFPSSKSTIQFFFKSNKGLLKSNPERFMINLFKTLNQ